MLECQSILTPIDYSRFSEPSQARAAFMENIQGVVELIKNKPHADDPALQRQAVRAYYEEFFTYIRAWKDKQEKASARKKDHEKAAKLKEEAAHVRNTLEDALIRFALCYMEIQRSLGIIREIKAIYQDKSKGKKEKKIEWSSGTSKMLFDAIMDRRALNASNRRLALGLHVLESFHHDHGSYEKLAQKIYGKKAESVILKPFRSALRNSDFDKAEKLVKDLQPPKKMLGFGKKGKYEGDVEILKEKLSAFIETLRAKHQNLLTDENGTKLYLSRQEIKVTLISQMREQDSKEQYLRKYFMPYIDYSRKGFTHLQEKLAVVGSLEMLLTLYISMMSGLAQPMTDLGEIREYETDVLNKVQYLLSSQLDEIAHIQHINDEDLQVFQNNMAAFEEVISPAAQG